MTVDLSDERLTPWETMARRLQFSNRWLSVYVDDVALPDGSRYEYTWLAPGGTGVAALGFNEAGEVLIEREYRHGVGEGIWQLPGGLANDGEDLAAAGLRELLEETGYAPRQVTTDTVRYLGSVWDNPALGPGESHIYEVHGLEQVRSPARDAYEFVSLHWVTLDWLLAGVRNGVIRDRVLITAILQHRLLGST